MASAGLRCAVDEKECQYGPCEFLQCRRGVWSEAITYDCGAGGDWDSPYEPVAGAGGGASPEECPASLNSPRTLCSFDGQTCDYDECEFLECRDGVWTSEWYADCGYGGGGGGYSPQGGASGGGGFGGELAGGASTGGVAGGG
jgi:hypothetical protein